MGDWAHRFGASPLMRMTASWSWSAWTDRIQVRGAMLRALGRAPLRSLWLTPPGAPCRGPQTEPDEDKTSEEKRLTEKAPYKFALPSGNQVVGFSISAPSEAGQSIRNHQTVVRRTSLPVGFRPVQV